MNPELPSMLESDAGPRLPGAGADQCDEADAQDASRRCCALRARYGDRLTIRVSIDHYGRAVHEAERGRAQLAADDRRAAVAGRQRVSPYRRQPAAVGRKPEAAIRRGFAALFAETRGGDRRRRPGRADGVPGDGRREADVPEITEACWGILGKSPDERDVRQLAHGRQAQGRRAVRRSSPARCCLTIRGSSSGRTLAEASGAVPLNHPHCAKFCVLGGGACSRG